MITQSHIDFLNERINALQARVEELEKENVATTNSLYELENELQSQIDALITYTLFEPNDVM